MLLNHSKPRESDSPAEKDGARMKNLLPHCITPHTVPSTSARSFSEAAARDLGSGFNVQDKGSRAGLALRLGNHHRRLRLQEGGDSFLLVLD